MKRSLGLILIIVYAATSLLAQSTPSTATSTSGASASNSKGYKSPGTELATALSTVTGIAISPLLGAGAVGCYTYLKTPSGSKEKLSWYAKPMFWIPALLLVGLVGLKDVLGAATPPGLKKPIDIAEVLENKVSGLVATGAIIPVIGFALSSHSGGGASLHWGPQPYAAIELNSVLQVLAAPFAFVAYGLVWLAAHSIHVLILLSPWGAVDAVLKGIRSALLAALTGISYINPWVGALISVALIIFSYFVAGWSFRLMVCGWVYCWDFLTLRRLRFKPEPAKDWAFCAEKLGEAPIRSYGKLVRTAQGGLEFRYKPWLVLPERTEVISIENPKIGQALFHPVLADIGPAVTRTLLNFPPRFRGHEEALGQHFGLRVEAVGLRAGLKHIGDWLRSLFGLSPAT